MAQNNTEKQIIKLISDLKIPFCGRYIQDLDTNKKFYISQFANISISGIGPVFYMNNRGEIFTILQRRFKDNFQWWFPGGYVELPPSSATSEIAHKKTKINFPDYQKLKLSTIDEYYQNTFKYNDWQKAKIEINDYNFVRKNFKKHKINWPKQIDFNWQEAWEREVLEETGIDLKKFKDRITFDFKFNKTLMIGAEKDRLINIDGKFASWLGILKTAPKTTPDSETEELKWVNLKDIIFDKKKKNYFTEGRIVNLYAVTLIEESLNEIVNYFIKLTSKVKNEASDSNLSIFNSWQNIQITIWQKFKQIENLNINKLQYVKKLLEFKSGNLDIAKNICGKDGKIFFHIFYNSAIFFRKNNLENKQDFIALNNYLENEFLQK